MKLLNYISQNKRRRAYFLFFALAALAVMILLFCLSHQTAEESGKLSEGIKVAQKPAVESIFGKVEEVQNENPLVWFINNMFRKVAHLVAYALLGFCLLGAMLNLDRIKALPLKILFAVGIGSLFGATDELHQLFIDGRSCELLDVGLDAVGIIAGALFMLLCYGIVGLFGKNQKKSA